MSSTVMVNLRRPWVTGGNKYDAVDNPHEFPAEWAEEKEVLDENDEPVKDKDGKVVKRRRLPPTAEVLEGGGRTVVVNQETANGSRVLKPQAVGDDVKEVGGALNDKGVEEPSQSVADAEKGAEAQNVEVGGKPRESGPASMAGTKKK